MSRGGASNQLKGSDHRIIKRKKKESGGWIERHTGMEERGIQFERGFGDGVREGSFLMVHC